MKQNQIVKRTASLLVFLLMLAVTASAQQNFLAS